MSQPQPNPGLEALESALSPTDRVDTTASQDNYRVSVPCFEGPLDLLLHLIRREQVNIHDIPVAKICASYLSHLELMKQLDFNVAGEFMLMAATLTYLKSVMLLPKEEGLNEDEDPRMPLVAQLLELERFKQAAATLEAKDWLFRDVYPRPEEAHSDSIPQESLLDAPLAPVETFQLLVALKVALARTTRKPIEIEHDLTSIRHQVEAVGRFLTDSEILDFVKLLPPQSMRHDVIVSFLAILELAKLKFIEILQTETFGPIQLRGVKPMEELNLALLDQY